MMNNNFQTPSMELTSFIYKFNEVDFLSFSYFIHNYKNDDSKSNILLLFFLILKNDNIFYSKINEIPFVFDVDYKLSLLVLKSLNLPPDIYNVFFKNIKEFKNNSLYKDSIKQVLFDISVLFSMHDDEIFFFGKNLNVHSVLYSKDCFNSYLNLFPFFNYYQKRQIFIEAISNFRVSSILIFNHLYLNHASLFSKKFLLSNISIFSQCNFKDILFTYIKKSPKKDLFKLGANLSFSSFSSDDLKNFFNDLFLFNEQYFYLTSSGFISNPKQNFPDIIDFLRKKNHFNFLSKKLKTNNKESSKQLKI